MSVHVHEADPRADRERLIGFLTGELPGHAGPDHYDWLYLGNPDGPARAWILESESDGPIGAAAAFPRRMRCRGREVVAWNLGDFAIRKDHRSLGPAVRLQRACLSPVLEGDVPFAYDHPSCNMMAVYRWLGVGATGGVVRYARPLRTPEDVVRLPIGAAATRGLRGVGDRLLRLSGRLLRLRTRLSATGGSLRFDDRFDTLDARLGASREVVGVRDATYLHWRHARCPEPAAGMVVVEEDGAMRGYAIHRASGPSATVTDLVGDGDPDVVRALLGELVRQYTERGAATLSVPALETSCLARVLPESGFRPRESKNFVVSTRKGGEYDRIVNDPARWYHTDGDRDV